MRRSVTVIGISVAIFGLVFAGGSLADDGQEVSLLALVDDVDGDGIPDAEDNCVEVPNQDQADLDLDGVGDVCDNCSEVPNPAQDDCDNDFCGNLCDCDYDQDGRSGFGDFGLFRAAWIIWPPHPNPECYDHTEPIGDTVGFGDFGFFTSCFGSRPGPSGTTPGTVACPLR
ncbi:MAG: thrombospondin type 3 repeat-containing protein [Deltaproteobacteria bacterium]|jgi:hypothetical protein|nr:thrombospondin type 3 repeat-containing protein [Deltaproteobacteria bacterium]